MCIKGSSNLNSKNLKKKKKKTENGFLAPFIATMVASLIQPVASSLVKGIFTKRSHEDWK